MSNINKIFGQAYPDLSRFVIKRNMLNQDPYFSKLEKTFNDSEVNKHKKIVKQLKSKIITCSH